MTQSNCDQCGDKSNCGQLLHQMGNSEGKSVVFNSLLAFVLPIGVFIAILAIAQQILKKYIESARWQTALASILALAAAVACAAIAKIIANRLRKS